MPNGVIQSREYRRLRAELKAQWQATNAPCICGHQHIDWDAPPGDPDSFELDHTISRKNRPDLALDPANMRPSALRCNRSKGAGTATPTIGDTTEDW